MFFDDDEQDPTDTDPNDYDDARNDWIDEGPESGDTESDLEPGEPPLFEEGDLANYWRAYHEGE